MHQLPCACMQQCHNTCHSWLSLTRQAELQGLKLTVAAVQAAKRVLAAHRLVLSGTPIQNDVAELWALFDFLMPGFLGTQQAFHAQYGKALSDAKGSARTTAQAEAGLLAMEQLHKQVLALLRCKSLLASTRLACAHATNSPLGDHT